MHSSAIRGCACGQLTREATLSASLRDLSVRNAEAPPWNGRRLARRRCQGPASAGTAGGGGTRHVSTVPPFWPVLQIASGIAVEIGAQSSAVSQTRRELLPLAPGQAGAAPATAGAAGVTQAGNAPPP